MTDEEICILLVRGAEPDEIRCCLDGPGPWEWSLMEMEWEKERSKA